MYVETDPTYQDYKSEEASVQCTSTITMSVERSVRSTNQYLIVINFCSMRSHMHSAIGVYLYIYVSCSLIFSLSIGMDDHTIK